MGKAGVPNTRTKAERDAQRQKVIALRLAGTSYREIAEQLGCTVSNARLVFLEAIKKEENKKLSEDLVYRLKTCRAEYKRIGLIKEAVVEIERLRGEKAELLKILTDLYEASKFEKISPKIDAARDAISQTQRTKVMDIVERLKELYRFAAKQKGRDWDEQDEIRHLFKLVFNIGYEAADEIERLREALLKIANGYSDEDGMRNIARQALGEKE